MRCGSSRKAVPPVQLASCDAWKALPIAVGSSSEDVLQPYL